MRSTGIARDQVPMRLVRASESLRMPWSPSKIGGRQLVGFARVPRLDYVGYRPRSNFQGRAATHHIGEDDVARGDAKPVGNDDNVRVFGPARAVGQARETRRRKLLRACRLSAIGSTASAQSTCRSHFGHLCGAPAFPESTGVFQECRAATQACGTTCADCGHRDESPGLRGASAITAPCRATGARIGVARYGAIKR